MNNDLISRSALKEEFQKLLWATYAIEKITNIIDNAPAIDTTFREVVAYECGQKSVERPKGEWYYGEDEQGQDGWFCSECGFFVPYYEGDINFIREYKACPRCLAEMVTYTGKDRDKGGRQ